MRALLQNNNGLGSFFFVPFVILLFSCTGNRQVELLEASDKLVSKKKYAEAAETLQRVVALNPESQLSFGALYKLGFIYETYMRDGKAAILSYEQFIAKSEDAVKKYEVLKRIAEIHFDLLRDPEAAIPVYKKLIAINPESLERDYFRFRIAKGYFRQNAFSSARREHQKLIEEYPNSQWVAHSRFEIGNSYFMEGKYKVAIEALKQVIRHHSQSRISAEAQFLMAYCLAQVEKLEQALRMYSSLKGIYISKKLLESRIASVRNRLKKRRN